MNKIETGIIIPVYNREKEFRICLNSLVAQYNFDAFYTIIIDDCSNEKILEVIKDFEDKLNIIYLKSNEHCGPGLCRNIGLNWCKEHNIEYIMFVDADDILAPGAVKIFYVNMKLYPYCDMISASFFEMFHDSSVIMSNNRTDLIQVFAKMYRLSGIGDIKFSDMPCLEDFDFNLRVISQPMFNIEYIDMPLYYRLNYLNDNSLTRQLNNSQEFEKHQRYNHLLAIYNFLVATAYNSNMLEILSNNFFLFHLSRIYADYEELVELYPEQKTELDIATKSILTYPIMKYLYNNFDFYNNEQICNIQYITNKKDFKGIADETISNNVVLFKESLYEFLKQHNFEFKN